jgi:hypothetical protein
MLLDHLSGVVVMKKLAVFGAALVAFAVLLVQSPAALATPISTTINLNQVYAGNTPDGGTPWLVATFEQTGAKTGTLTLTSHFGDSDFLQGLNNSHSAVGWAFYLNQSLAALSCGTGACASNNALFGGSYNTGSVPGTFNLAFGWDSGSRFDGTDSAVYNMTFTNLLTGNPFVANASGWSSVAHVQGITGGCSGWIVAGTGTLGDQDGPCTNTPPPVSVPEPAGLGVFGLGALLIGLFIGLRRRYA